jgi:type III restriction enzyme
METGTGKTYVYLRTILELFRQYQFFKFLIVVPSVAIREGVLQAVRMTSSHMDGIYGRVLREFRVFSSERLADVRQFATSEKLQVLIINIDSFNKASNVARRSQEHLGGATPLEVLASCRPIVILDEPQNFESELAAAAIADLGPLCTLRYSATHRREYNLVYRLNPAEAHDLGLVKRIEVLSVRPEGVSSTGSVRLISVLAKKRTVTATLEIDRRRGAHVGPAKVRVTRTGDDLFVLSGHLPAYRGLQVAGIDVERQQVELSDGTVLTADSARAEDRDAILETQIHETVREHLEKELAIRRYFKTGPRLKVLSLFFIDRVANYAPSDGKFRVWFERVYNTLSRDKRYRELDLPKAAAVHAGYFSAVRGRFADTTGNSAADDNTYALIMQHKERLLSPDEPVRFIFSHSALREGWDNPNVFQICTLNQTKSEIKKRQEIGRGLRLPVAETGRRVTDRAINFLTVIANESYDDFARKLQTEIADEWGVDFGSMIQKRGDRRLVTPKAGWRTNAAFKRLWDAVSARTEFRVTIDRAQLVRRAVEELRAAPKIQKPKLVATKALLDIDTKGVHAKLRSIRDRNLETGPLTLPNPVDPIQDLTGITRSTIVDVLIASGRLGEFVLDPDRFIEYASKAIADAATRCMVDGASFKKVPGMVADLDDFETRLSEAYVSRLLPVEKSIYGELEVESDVERRFAKALDARADVKFFLKLPNWVLISTPAGGYNPDWAIIKKAKVELYLVRETKSAWHTLKLRAGEKAKIDCAAKHFAALEIDFSVATDATQL